MLVLRSVATKDLHVERKEILRFAQDDRRGKEIPRFARDDRGRN
jgi:hypothetical protein